MLCGIDEQVTKAAKAVPGLAPVKRNRFIALDGAVKSVNRELEAKARTLAGLKGYADVTVMPSSGWSVLAGVGVPGSLIGVIAGCVAAAGVWPS
jgi:hypothetical protein